MKRALVILVVLLCSVSFTQTITEYHIGGLYSLSFEPESSWDKQENFNFRASAEVLSPTWQALNITAKGRFIFTTPTEQSFGQLWLIHKNILGDFSLGKQPRPISIQRPNPATCDAGFEPVSKLVIPGATPGFLYSNNFIPGLGMQVGVYDHGDHLVQYNLGLYLEKYNLGIAWYSSKNDYGAAASIKTDMASFTIFGSDKHYSTFLELENDIVKPYVDLVYDRKLDEWLTQEIGITKELVNPIEFIGFQAELKWLLGLAYNHTDKKIVAYSYLHL